MKKIVLKLIVGLIVCLPIISKGQSSIDKLYKKYADKEGFVSVNISKEMLEMFTDVENVRGEKGEDVREAMNDLQGLQILTYEPEGEPEFDFLKEIEKTLPMEDFDEIMVVKSKEGSVRFLVRKEKNDKISEMIMIANEGKKEVTVMSFLGNMDLETISRISKGMNIQGMDEFEVEIDEGD